MSGGRNGISSSNSRFPFTASQWQELEDQALIFKYMIFGMPISPDLLFTIKRGTALECTKIRYLELMNKLGATFD
ncbi:hypothetical protein RJ639_045844 [Escallonia herrerae]|uniref:Growth-regulating factor n=1 Tax=Escallonia herrerae TaxID=1293975 RepID=A0AA88W4I4_9ASTE|nr:hypothetical protein RJ639_045844 [Escallonia herrerae]